MKSIIKSLALVLSLVAISSLTAQAQTTKKPKSGKKAATKEQYFDDKSFVNQLWYGGNVGLGFGGTNLGSSFNISLFPMVGYKFTNDLSLGPRLGIGYQSDKDAYSQTSLSTVLYSFGAFGRFKFAEQFFAHAEINDEFINQSITYLGAGASQSVSGSRVTEYVGLGYGTSGKGSWGTEIVLLYKINETNIYANPISIRFGLNYNF
jgi:hypothetical protein